MQTPVGYGKFGVVKEHQDYRRNREHLLKVPSEVPKNMKDNQTAQASLVREESNPYTSNVAIRSGRVSKPVMKYQACYQDKSIISQC